MIEIVLKEQDVIDLFEEHTDAEYLAFEKVEEKRSNRPDLHAFLLLDELCPSTQEIDIIAAASRDKIWLSVTALDLATKITEDGIIELLRCGVSYDEDSDLLQMFT